MAATVEGARAASLAAHCAAGLAFGVKDVFKNSAQLLAGAARLLRFAIAVLRVYRVGLVGPEALRRGPRRVGDARRGMEQGEVHHGHAELREVLLERGDRLVVAVALVEWRDATVAAGLDLGLQPDVFARDARGGDPGRHFCWCFGVGRGSVRVSRGSEVWE